MDFFELAMVSTNPDRSGLSNVAASCAENVVRIPLVFYFPINHVIEYHTIWTH